MAFVLKFVTKKVVLWKLVPIVRFCFEAIYEDSMFYIMIKDGFYVNVCKNQSKTCTGAQHFFEIRL